MLEDTLMAASESGGSNPLVPDVSEMIIVAISFLLLFFLIKKFVVPNFEKTYQARKKAIEGGLEKAADAQAEAQSTKQRYEKRLEEAHLEANSIRETAQAEAADILVQARQQSEQQAQRIIEQGQKTLASEREVAEKKLRGEVGTLSIQLAEKVVGEALKDDARSQRVVDRFLADLEREQNNKTSV